MQEAGGVIIDKSGGPYNIMKPDIIAASNLKLATEVKEIIANVEQQLEIEGNLPSQLAKKQTK